MNEQFRKHVESLNPSFEALLKCTPFVFGALPKQLPKAGVYLFSEEGRHLYVGRGRLKSSAFASFSRSNAACIARQPSGRAEGTGSEKSVGVGRLGAQGGSHFYSPRM